MKDGKFIPPAYLVRCDECNVWLDLCEKRTDRRKYNIGNGIYRCHPCQDRHDPKRMVPDVAGKDLR